MVYNNYEANASEIITSRVLIMNIYCFLCNISKHPVSIGLKRQLTIGQKLKYTMSKISILYIICINNMCVWVYVCIIV